MSVQEAKEPTAKYTALTQNHLDNPAYNPVALLDSLLERLKLKNDAALARLLELPPAVVSKVRRRQACVTDAILIRMHDVTGWSISDLRAGMGLKSHFNSL